METHGVANRISRRAALRATLKGMAYTAPVVAVAAARPAAAAISPPVTGRSLSVIINGPCLPIIIVGQGLAAAEGVEVSIVNQSGTVVGTAGSGGLNATGDGRFQMYSDPATLPVGLLTAGARVGNQILVSNPIVASVSFTNPGCAGTHATLAGPPSGTIIYGNILPFTGSGFTPGMQIATDVTFSNGSVISTTTVTAAPATSMNPGTISGVDRTRYYPFGTVFLVAVDPKTGIALTFSPLIGIL